MSSAAPTADAGPQLRIATHGLGFSPGRPGAANAETPEEAVSKLALLDVANYGRTFHVPADRMPGSTLLVGPLADDGEGNQHVLCWHRHGPGVTAERPGVVSLVVVPVDHKREGLTGEQWRDRMIAEAQREDHPRWGKTHFWQTKAVADFRALPHCLTESFGRDGEGWSQACDWWMERAAAGITFAPWNGEN